MTKATQSCFPVSGPTSHLKMTRPPGFFILEAKVEENGASWRVRSGDKTNPRSQNVEAKMVKTMSAGCVVAC